MAGRGSHALTSERNWSAPAPYHLTASKLDTPSRRKTKDSKKASHGDAGAQVFLAGRARLAQAGSFINVTLRFAPPSTQQVRYPMDDARP
jgi:hypothetical protein